MQRKKSTPTDRCRDELIAALGGVLTHSIPKTGEALGCCPRSVYNEIADGKLASIKMRGMRRVTTAAILEYLAARESEEA